MGYKPQLRTFVFEFGAESPWAGAQVVVTSMTFGDLRRWFRGESTSDGTDDGEPWDEQQKLVHHIVRWNLEDDDGQPLPVTVESLRRLEPGMILALKQVWIDSIRGVPDGDPLGRSSTSGEPSAALADLMAASSSAPES